MVTLHSNEFIKNEINKTFPDYVMYIPHQKEYESDNVHLYVVKHEKYGGYVAFWTQSTVENAGNNHLVMAKSQNGTDWTSPAFIAGAERDSADFGIRDEQASWGFPIVTRSGRIYLFYYREVKGNVDNSRQLTAAFSCMYSDDVGESWSESHDIPQRLTPYDISPDIQDNIVYQLPQRMADGRYLAGFTKYVSKSAQPQYKGGCRVYFYRFENIDLDPEIKDIEITFLPHNDKGIHVCKPDGSIGRAEEPSVVTLPDGRLMCCMRTNLGGVYYSLSSDNAESWTSPQPLYFSDNTPFVNPLSPCPLYELSDGSYLQLYHGVCDIKSVYFPRNPLRSAVGHYDKNAKQPIVFDKKDDKLFMELDENASDMGYGRELAIYGTMTQIDGRDVLWYPDRKFFLLGKIIK